MLQQEAVELLFPQLLFFLIKCWTRGCEYAKPGGAKSY